MIEKAIRRILPQPVLATLKNYKILSCELGQYKSMRRWDCVDSSGAPIPWYTYPAIEYIKQLDLSDKVVFEYGSGSSTPFWAGRCKKLISVEDNQNWYSKIKGLVTGNIEYSLLEESQE